VCACVFNRKTNDCTQCDGWRKPKQNVCPERFIFICYICIVYVDKSELCANARSRVKAPGAKYLSVYTI